MWTRIGYAFLTLIMGSFAFAPAQAPGTEKKKGATNESAELSPGSILQAGGNPIDLGTALQLAGVENPELLLARQRITESAALRQLAAAQLLPNLNLGTNYDLHRGVLQQSAGDILKVNRESLYVGLGASAVGAGTVNIPGLNYNLNVGEAWYGILIARQRTATARFAAAATNNEVLLRVCLAYLDLLRSEGRRSIAIKNRGEAAELARLTAAYAQTGQGRKADADRAEVELKKRDAEFTQAEGEILAASARLAQLLNLDPSTRLKALEGWVVPAPLVPEPIPLSELLAIALMQRPELAARRSEVKAALYELSLAKALPFAPNVILGYSAGGFGGGSNIAPSSPGINDFAGRSDLDVAVFWTFRNLGVGNVALFRAADSRAKQSRFREIETLNLVRTQVAEAFGWTAARLLQIEAAEKAVMASQNAYTQDLTRIRGGLGLPLEVIDSQRLLARSRYEYLDGIVEYNRAQFQLWVALGQPPANWLARPLPAVANIGPRIPARSAIEPLLHLASAANPINP